MHSLNLAVQDATRHVPMLRDTLDLTQETVNFINASPKRTRILDDLKKEDYLKISESNMSQRLLCPTRFTVCYQSLQSLEKNFKFVTVAVEEISKTCSDESGAKASGLLR
jgi:hypothetical protein